MWERIYNWLNKDKNLAYLCLFLLFLASLVNNPVRTSDLFVATCAVWFLIQYYNRPKEEEKDGNSNQG